MHYCVVLWEHVLSSQLFQAKVQESCKSAPADQAKKREGATTEALFCRSLRAPNRTNWQQMAARQHQQHNKHFLPSTEGTRGWPCSGNDARLGDELQQIALFGKKDTAKELQDHAAKTQDTLVDAFENAEAAEIKSKVFLALTLFSAIKEFDTIARLETQAIDAYNDAHHYRS